MSSKFYVGVTDSRWFNYLAAQKPDEVNFWMPGASGFRILPEAGLFLRSNFTPQLALRRSTICRNITGNRPAKPLRTSVPTLKSSGFFIACGKSLPAAACRGVG